METGASLVRQGANRDQAHGLKNSPPDCFLRFRRSTGLPNPPSPIFFSRGEKRKTPKIINYLGKVLPFAMIGMLVVYCFKDVKPLAFPYALPEIIAALIVGATYLWKRNTLISVASGTVSYMLLVQLVFV